MPFYHFSGEGSPTSLDCRKKGTLIRTSLLEDRGQVTFATNLFFSWPPEGWVLHSLHHAEVLPDFGSDISVRGGGIDEPMFKGSLQQDKFEPLSQLLHLRKLTNSSFGAEGFSWSLLLRVRHLTLELSLQGPTKEIVDWHSRLPT